MVAGVGFEPHDFRLMRPAKTTSSLSRYKTGAGGETRTHGGFTRLLTRQVQLPLWDSSINNFFLQHNELVKVRFQYYGGP